jgi:multiple sugar transport system permease protein
MIKNSHLIKNKTKSLLISFVRSLLIFGICYVIMYPLIVKFSVAIMSVKDLSDLSVKWISKAPTFDNFIKAFTLMKFPIALFNSVFLSVTVTILQIAVCTLAAYGYARTNFKGKGILFALSIFTLIVPPYTYMVSTYMQFRNFDLFGLVTAIKGESGLMNTYFPFIIKAVTGAGLRCGLYIYIMRQFFRNMPLDTEEAALVDGASIFKTFYSVMLPNATPALATVTILSFVWQYNDSLYTSLLAPKFDFLTNALAGLTSQIFYAAGGGAASLNPILVSATVNAGALLMLIPIIVLFVGVQKYFVQGVERSGIVG